MYMYNTGQMPMFESARNTASVGWCPVTSHTGWRALQNAEPCVGDDDAGYLVIILNRPSECWGEWTYFIATGRFDK